MRRRDAKLGAWKISGTKTIEGQDWHPGISVIVVAPTIEEAMERAKYEWPTLTIYDSVHYGGALLWNDSREDNSDE